MVNQYKKQQLAITVTQYVTLKEVFFDLCLKKLCASAAPGQPPKSDKACKVLSDVRHLPHSAAFLSFTYIKNATKLSIAYR